MWRCPLCQNYGDTHTSYLSLKLMFNLRTKFNSTRKPTKLSAFRSYGVFFCEACNSVCVCAGHVYDGSLQWNVLSAFHPSAYTPPFPSSLCLVPFPLPLHFILVSFHTASEMKRCKLFFLLIKRMKAGICLALLIALDWKWIEWHRFGNSWIIFSHKITSGIGVQRDRFQLSPWLIHFLHASAMFVLSPLVRKTYQDILSFK